MSTSTLPVPALPAASTELSEQLRADLIAEAFLLGYSGSTREAYAADLKCWARFLDGPGVEPFSVTRAHVEAYARDLEDQGRARSTVARRLSTLAGFYAYAEDEGVIERSPVRRVRRPRVSDDSQTLGLDREELTAFLATAVRSSERDHALACLLALNGLRISEALRANVEDLGHQRGHRTLAIVRKGEKPAIVPLAPRTGAAIDLVVAERTKGPLFSTRTGGRLDRRAAARTVQKLAVHAGLDKRISPHSLRHSFVTAALDAGAQLRDVQDAAGHADPRTTRRYDRGRHNLDRHPTYAVAGYVA